MANKTTKPKSPHNLWKYALSRRIKNDNSLNRMWNHLEQPKNSSYYPDYSH